MSLLQVTTLGSDSISSLMPSYAGHDTIPPPLLSHQQIYDGSRYVT